MRVYKPEQSHEELLAAIHEEAESEGGNTALVIPPFAVLLVKLSREADTQATAIKKLTVGLYVFTVVLMLIGGAQLFYTVFPPQLPPKPQIQAQSPNDAKQ